MVVVMISYQLEEQEVGELIQATTYAIVAGLALNRMITIAWELTGVTDARRATGVFLKLACEALRRGGHPSAYIYVIENGTKLGLHAHVLMHVPPSKARWFGYRQRKWLGCAGGIWCKGFIKTKPIGGSYRLANSSERYLSNLGRVLRYCLKDSDEQSRRRYGIRAKPTRGPVSGRRCQISRNLSASSREAAKRCGKSL